VLAAGDWSARVRVARRLLAQAWLPTPAGWLAFRTPSLPLPPLRLPRLRAASAVEPGRHRTRLRFYADALGGIAATAPRAAEAHARMGFGPRDLLHARGFSDF
jgi:hypothetical protein